MDDPNFNTQAFIKNLDTQGRPVIFMVHGIANSDQQARDGYSSAADWYNAQYGHLPENQRPIIIGVDWDSQGPFSYGKANENAISTGNRFGEVLEQFDRFHPESSINVVAHSLGNRMVMEGVAAHDVRIDNYLAVQAAVDMKEISPDGRFEDVVETNEIRNMAATYTDGDKALIAHSFQPNRDEALGNYANEMHSREFGTYRTYDMGPHNDNGFFELNHYSYNDPKVNEHVVLDFFGKDGKGFQKAD
jgi:hypothetical protein